ncbi:MAG: 2-oxoglutarate dehydrogenase complex dihydrolipoyllysine-residue succinyltransferase [Gammaproteobacteria bacterium]|nr:MAG: 2-oxoglutarate dehydrogenase complex dihydrolipoyllysine-residue succinyltransferase [Gammaproteobacteria bacterium]
MKIDVTIPELAESVTEAIIGDWLKKPGEFVEEGEQLVDVETDKVILEITAPETGKLASITKHKNERVQSNDVIAVINISKKRAKSAVTNGSTPVTDTPSSSNQEQVNVIDNPSNISQIRPAPSESLVAKYVTESVSKTSPAVRKLAAENNINVESVQGTGKDGRVTKKDIEALVENAAPATASDIDSATEIMLAPQFSLAAAREDKRVPMTGLRKSISKRLVQAQHESAILTTFNEVNMQSIIDLRQRYKESFEESHGVKLGFMSFFVKAAVEALKEFPIINASVEDTDVIYHDYFDIGVAVSTQRGLVVPIVRDADGLSFAGVEKTINDLAVRAQDNKVAIEELTGGTFTISNGGVFGSMMSTPIINPPQSAILGMHSIQARPIAQSGEVIIAPMMYLALSYDHRIIDGKEAVQFLSHVKSIIEDPNRLLLQV